MLKKVSLILLLSVYTVVVFTAGSWKHCCVAASLSQENYIADKDDRHSNDHEAGCNETPSRNITASLHHFTGATVHFSTRNYLLSHPGLSFYTEAFNSFSLSPLVFHTRFKKYGSTPPVYILNCVYRI